MQDPQHAPPTPNALVTLWRERAAHLRHVAAAEMPARAYEEAARELEAALTASADELLSITEAALRVGLSTDTIRKAIAMQRLPNAGRKGKPFVRSGDLARVYPKRIVANQSACTYDVGADARSLLARRGA